MEFRVLGPVEVASGDRRAGLGSGRRRTVLAVLLAARGEAVTTDRLIDAVWGTDPPVSARKSLQSHLSRLRSALARVEPTASEPLLTEGDSYRVDLVSNDLDAERFETLLAEAREVAADAPEQALELLDEAKRLWRGPSFGELAAHPAVRAEAVRLERLRATAAADHVDARLGLDRHEEVISELQATVADDPFGERAHAQLMMALFRSGRQADALACYRRLQELLREEVGVDPSPALRELHQKVLHQDAGLAAPPPRPAPDGESRRPTTGPPAASSPRPTASVFAPDLIGRDEDVAAVVARITTTPLVTLTGPGGVGKTRLAEQVADQAADRFDDGVAACGLAGVRDSEGVGGALITALGIQPRGERSEAETLVETLGDRRLLLLLDNCEHVLSALTPLVDAILARCPHVTVLATSRERLHLPGEHVWPVGPLDVPDAEAHVDEVLATSAGALFCARAKAVEPAFALTDDNAGAVAELCRRLDGMPLAIELAAARTRALAPEDLVERLDHRFSLLAGGPSRGAGRHRTLQAVVSWSYDLLAPAEAELFDRLSAFAGAFPLAAAEELCAGGAIARADVAGLLGELVDKSMVTVQRAAGGSVRYRLLDTLRDFGVRRLAEAGATDTYRQAHAAYHLGLAEAFGPEVRGPGERAAVVAIDAAIDDLRAAHVWMVSTGDVDGALRLPAALSDYVFYRLRDEITTWTRRALEMRGAENRPAYPAALAAAAKGATSRGECERARREAQAALRHTKVDTGAGLGALDALGTAALYDGLLDDLLVYADQQAEAADRLGDHYSRAFAGVLRVLAHSYRGDQDAAVACAAELQAVADVSGNPTMRAFAAYCHGEVHLDSHPAQAAAALQRAAELAREVNNSLIEGVSTVSLASLRGRLGQTREALILFREVVVHWRRLGDYTHLLTTVRNLVELLAQIGAEEPAAVLHGAATEGRAPSFGTEAERLAAAWAQVEDRLGPDAAAAAADRGRRLSATQMGNEAVARLDELLDR